MPVNTNPARPKEAITPYAADQKSAVFISRRERRPQKIFTIIVIGCRIKKTVIELSTRNSVENEILPPANIPIKRGLNKNTQDP